jgi:outer membrane murein-binding lipoprotein Lpp
MPEWVLQVLGMAGAAVGIYAGIRADLAAIRVMAESAANEANQAHARIDNLLMGRGGK